MPPAESGNPIGSNDHDFARLIRLGLETCRIGLAFAGRCFVTMRRSFRIRNFLRNMVQKEAPHIVYRFRYLNSPVLVMSMDEFRSQADKEGRSKQGRVPSFHPHSTEASS